jgi:hypothetical protein
VFASINSWAQTQQKIEMKIDSIGNAKITVSMNMTAQQWQVWLSSLGNNPAALKREIERSMPAYFLDDFKLDKDDMNRSFNLSLKAYGVCEIDKRGKWTIDTDQKNANVTELTDHKFMLVSSPPELGGTVQQTFLIEFPAEAKDIKVDKDAFGQSVFDFKMDGPSSSGFNFLRYAGIFFIVIGGAWGGASLIKKTS